MPPRSYLAISSGEAQPPSVTWNSLSGEKKKKEKNKKERNEVRACFASLLQKQGNGENYIYSYVVCVGLCLVMRK